MDTPLNGVDQVEQPIKKRRLNSLDTGQKEEVDECKTPTPAIPAKRSEPKTLNIPHPSELKGNPEWLKGVHFSQPYHLTSYWRDRDGGVMYGTRPKKYHDASIGSDLSEGFQTFVEKRHDNDSSLKPVLSAIKAAKYDLNGNHISFVSYRNNLNKIMGTVYDRRTEWSMFVSRKNNIIYLKINHLKRHESEQQKRFSYWGYKFEDYSTDSAPRKKRKRKKGEPKPALAPPATVVDANEEFCSIIRLRLNKHRIVLGAEIDCCDRNDYSNLIELKTSKVILNKNIERNFKRYKLLKYWIQSFLAGVGTIVVGFRDEHGIVKQLVKYETLKLPSMVEEWMWNANTVLNFADYVLTFLKKHVKEGRNYELSFRHPFAQIVLERIHR